MANGPQRADLVLEGGGVKGIGLVGAISVLAEAGYVFPRVAGTSAGAIVGALVASGMPVERMHQVMRETDYSKFQDPGLLDRFGHLGRGLSLLLEKGIYEGDYLKEYLAALLPDEMEVFAGMRMPDDPDSDLPQDKRFRLVVMASDVSRQRLVRFPWDYRGLYGLDPDRQSVLEAVRASMSIPFFFEPTYLEYHGTKDGRPATLTSTLVDGGMLSNFPVDAFDRRDGAMPRWPTFGIKLSGRPSTQPRPAQFGGPVSLSVGMLGTLLGWRDRAHIDDPDVCARTIFVDTAGVSAVDFGLSREDQDRLYQSGRAAAVKFLAGWDFEAYKRQFR